MTLEEVQRLNVILAKQMEDMIQTLFGHSRPFVLILPGLEGEDTGGLASNVDGGDLKMVLRNALASSDGPSRFYPRQSKESVS